MLSMYKIVILNVDTRDRCLRSQFHYQLWKQETVPNSTSNDVLQTTKKNVAPHTFTQGRIVFGVAMAIHVNCQRLLFQKSLIVKKLCVYTHSLREISISLFQLEIDI